MPPKSCQPFFVADFKELSPTSKENAALWSLRPPIAATKQRPRRVDYEYERAGTASVFLFSEPLAGWRQATARARRTKTDWAVEVAGVLPSPTC